MYNLTIGCDPELFVTEYDMWSNPRFKSAHDLIPGTKEEPYKVEGGAVQVDGVAAEFNIDPVTSLLDFTKNIRLVQNQMQDMIWDKDDALFLTASPTAKFSLEYFNDLPMEAKLLGCQPDYNAYTGEENIPPETDLPFRTAGGHIHIGWGEFLDCNDPEHIDLCRRVVKQLDAVLFPASMIWDSDQERRQLYGNKGAFRPKSYGVEYRPLSCAWLKSPETIQFIYEQTMRNVDLLLNKNVEVYN